MDAFEDLWKQAAPTSQPAARSQPLNAVAASAASRSNQARPDTFSLLSSAPGSRSLTPTLPAKRPPSTVPSPGRTANPSNGDAFSGLMPFGGNASSGTLSLADRQARIEEERKAKDRKREEESRAHGAFWDRFEDDGLLKPTRTTGPALSSRTSTPSLQPTGLSPSPVPPAPPKASEDLWDLDAFAAPVPRAAPVAPSISNDLLGFEDSSEAPVYLSQSSSGNSSKGPTPRTISPGEFDFGDREDRGFLDDDDGEDDILGALARPVDTVRQISPALQDASHPSPPRSPLPRNPRTVSPPPHILGQIVEMGFSPLQARVALGATESGVDVQAALETLLQSQSSEDFHPPRPSSVPRRIANDEASERRDRRLQGAPRRNHDSDELPPPGFEDGERHRRRWKDGARLHYDTDELPPPNIEERDQKNLQEQADRLLAQASDFGLSMFNKANALWKQGREHAQKLYEERSRTTTGDSGRSSAAGRPKWMVDEYEHSGHPEPDTASQENGFKDHETSPAGSPRQPSKQEQHRANDRSAADDRKRSHAVETLLGNEPVSYISPHRRRARPAPADGPSTSSLSIPIEPPSRTAPPVISQPLPKPKAVRVSVPINPSALAESEMRKSKGTDLFKLGQFAEAESAYSAALEVLPAGHSAVIPLRNNRAVARLKIGNQAGAIEDSSAVLSLLQVEGADYRPDAEEEWEGVKLGDALVKALSRRAEAWEMGEKWSKAAVDWQQVAELGTWIGRPRWEQARKGVERCKKMMSGEASASTAPPRPKPRPKPKPTAAARAEPPSEAVTRLQAATSQQEAEDNLRAALKDTIDSRLSSWKAGKESNIRALIASLETVLWPELGWQKVGLHELVTPAQVKSRYVRAIARLHPDKLSAMNVSVENRMIANGVFGTLNEAWNAFQQ